MKPMTYLAVVLALALGLGARVSAREFPGDESIRLARPKTLRVRFWTCQARGRIDAGLYGSFTGFGRSHSAPRDAAVGECREIAQGCYVTSCRPGL